LPGGTDRLGTPVVDPGSVGAMEITPRAQMLGDLKPLDPSHFAGRAAARDLLAAQKPALSTSAIVVRFEPGARNYWHAHEGGQVLYVIEGAGWVQVRGGAPQRIQVGDAVRAQPGEARWFEESPAPGD